MEQPTKEEVEKMKRRIARNGLDCVLPNEIESLVDAYLALREEVKAERETEKKLNDMSTKNLLSHIATLKAENQALKAQVAELSGYLMRLVNENADHQLEIHKLKNTLAANHIQMNSRQDELVPRYRSLEFGWHRYWLTRTYFEQAAKDANEMARLVQANIRELFEHDGMVGWDELPEWKDAQTIIDRYKSDGRRVWKRKEIAS